MGSRDLTNKHNVNDNNATQEITHG